MLAYFTALSSDNVWRTDARSVVLWLIKRMGYWGALGHKGGCICLSLITVNNSMDKQFTGTHTPCQPVRNESNKDVLIKLDKT